MDTNQVSSADDEISLIDLLVVLLKGKWIILGITLFSAVLGVLLALISAKMPPEKSFMPNTYVSKGQVILNTNTSTANILLKSTSFLDELAEKFNLAEFAGLTGENVTKTDIRKFTEGLIKTQSVGRIYTISCTSTSPQLCKDILDFTFVWLENKIDELGLDYLKIQEEVLRNAIDQKQIELIQAESEFNKTGTKKDEDEFLLQQKLYEQLKSDYELLQIKIQSDPPMFRMIGEPEVPDKKEATSRKQMCVVITFAGFFISVFLVFLLNAIRNIKNDEEVMNKLREGLKN